MRVLMFEPTGGYWPYTHELAEALGSFTQVYLLTSQKHSGVYSYGMHATLRPMAAHLGAPGNPLAKVAWALDRLFCSLSWLLARKRLAGKFKPDLVHLQSTIPLLDQYLLPAFAIKYPVLYTVHDVLPFTNSRAFGSFKALQAVYNAPHHLIVHSEANKRELMAVFGIAEGKISVIPHGLRKGERLNKCLAKERLSLPREEKLILVFGGIRESKGLDLAIGALAEVRGELPEASLVVAGSIGGDVNLACYYRLAQEAGVARQIHWRLEYIPELEVGTYFSAADLVLLPYKKFHAQSGVLLQAYKYSVPVVVTDKGALGETVRQDCVGLVAREATAQELAECIVRILRSEDLQAEFSQNMRQAQEKYDWDNVATGIMALYEQLLKQDLSSM